MRRISLKDRLADHRSAGHALLRRRCPLIEDASPQSSRFSWPTRPTTACSSWAMSRRCSKVISERDVSGLGSRSSEQLSVTTMSKLVTWRSASRGFFSPATPPIATGQNKTARVASGGLWGLPGSGLGVQLAGDAVEDVLDVAADRGQRQDGDDRDQGHDQAVLNHRLALF